MRNIFCIQFILSTNIKTALAFLFYLSQATIVKAPQTNMLQSAITANAGQVGTHGAERHRHTHTHTHRNTGFASFYTFKYSLKAISQINFAKKLY